VDGSGRTVEDMRVLRYLLVVALFGVAGCSQSESSGALGAVLLRDVDGVEVSLDDVDDELVVVNFWASYCKPCIREMPALQAVSEEYPAVRFIGVNALDEKSVATEMVAETGVEYDIWFDERGEAMTAAGIRSLPGTLIIDGGQVVFSKLGEISEEELTEALDAAGA
jgi:thiol-disulfide isomerase/thioredoxin